MEQKDAVLEGRKSRCCCMVDAIRYRRSFRLRTCVRSMLSREIVRVQSRRRLDQHLYHRSRSSTHVRRMSDRGGEGSGPSPREATFLSTLSQTSAPQLGGRRHSVVTIERVSPTLFGRNRRESIAGFPLGGVTRILPNRRDPESRMSAPPSGRGSTHNLQLDIMDDIADLKARKVRLRMYRTSTEQVYEIQPLEGNSSAQRYTLQPKQRFSEMPTPSVSQTSSLRKRVSELPRAASASVSGAAGIVCSNTDLISILNSLGSSATEINRCGEEAPSSRDDSKSNWPGKTTEQKGSRSKSFRSNSFDVSTLHGAKSKLSGSSKAAISTFMVPSNWFTKRHQPMSKKPEDLVTASLSLKFDKSKVVKAVKSYGTTLVEPKWTLRSAMSSIMSN
ncbi:uncharacterized protein LOC126914696 isoform X4 [Bombus affinis]|nr:uncharacterized protein LOC126914696 isoform X3 [Bombus affinis]XP_050574967.1 uncharacterized protein LOC126914696 isoform X4 [Bombus affinis]